MWDITSFAIFSCQLLPQLHIWTEANVGMMFVGTFLCQGSEEALWHFEYLADPQDGLFV